MMLPALMNGALLVGLWMGAMDAPPDPSRVRGPHPPGASARPAHWKMVATAGRVETRLPSSPRELWRPARRGDRVAPLTSLRTLERARATLTRRGDLILVDAGSEIVVPDSPPGEGTRVMQRSGNAIYKVAPRQKGDRFEVRTPYLVAGVKGTRFSVHVQDGAAAVNVLEGVVEVTSLITGESRDLLAGESVVVDVNDPRMEKQEMAPIAPHPPAREPDPPLTDLLATSERLDRTLEKDAELLDADSLDLWSDLSDDTTLTRTIDGTLDKTLTRLDPASQDTRSDPTLLDALPLLGKRP